MRLTVSMKGLPLPATSRSHAIDLLATIEAEYPANSPQLELATYTPAFGWYSSSGAATPPASTVVAGILFPNASTNRDA